MRGDIQHCEWLDPRSLMRWLEAGALLGGGDGRVVLGITQTTRPAATAFYAPDFFLGSAAPWLFYKQYRSISAANLNRSLASMAAGANEDWVWTSPSYLSFERNFEDLQREIREGRLRKGVPFACEFAHIPGGQGLNPDRRAAALRSVLAYAAGRAVMPYGFWSNGEGMLGCTPETLFQHEGAHVETMAIAGTRIAGDERRLPLLEDPKERSEHQIVVDAITASLKGLGAVQAGTTEVAHFASLSHLKTTLRVEMQGLPRFNDLVKALHPTPALGAYPKEEGWRWLRGMEVVNSFDRNRFGAPFGLSLNGGRKGNCVVAIRNIQWTGSQAVLCAGCGVNEMAVVEHEWNEIRGKIAATKKFLGLEESTRRVRVMPANYVNMPAAPAEHKVA